MIEINKNKDITTALVTVNATASFSCKSTISLKDLSKNDEVNINVFNNIKNLMIKTTCSINSQGTLNSSFKTSQLPTESSLISNRYGSPIRIIGKGSGGIVRMHVVDGKEYAIKEYRERKRREKLQRYRSKIEQEYLISKKLKHQNIIELFDFYSDSSSSYLVMEYCPTDLFNVLSNASKNMELLSIKETECYFKQIIFGLNYLQKQGIAHRDIKPENCVVDRNGILKLIDFGCSKSFKVNSIVNGMAGSEPYIAPEVYYPNYDMSLIDIWSAMVVYIVISNNRFPWRRAYKEDKRYYKFASCDDERFKMFSECRSPHIRKFILKVMDPNPHIRMNVQELIQSKEFKLINCCSIDNNNHKHLL